MPVYGMEKMNYVNDLTPMVEEPSLEGRLGDMHARLRRVLGICQELQHGPTQEPDEKSLPIAGVLNLGAACEKLTMALENEVMVIAKRIGRL